MLFNKWINFAVSAIGGLAATSSALDWSAILSPHASAGVAAVALALRTITAALAPAAGSTAVPTNGAFVTHS